MTWLLALILKPLFALILFCSAAVIARGILALLPPGRLKRILSFRWNV